MITGGEINMGVPARPIEGPAAEPVSGPQVPVHFAANLGLVIALDHFLIKPAVEDGTMPGSLRGPAMVGSLWATNRALTTVGLGAKWSWARLAASLPLFYSMQAGASKAMTTAGIDPSSPINEYGSVAAGMMPFYLARHSATLKAGIASAAGTGLEGAGYVFLAKGGVAGGAGVLGGVCQGAGAGGVVMLGNYIGGLAVSGITGITGISDDPHYELMQFAYDQMIAEFAGEYTSALFGSIIKGMQAIGAYASDDFEEMLWEGLDDKVDEFVRASEELTRSLEESILFTPFEGVSYRELLAGNYRVSSYEAERVLEVMASIEPDEFKGIYSFLKMTAHRNECAARLMRVIDRNGAVGDSEAFGKYFDDLVSRTKGRLTAELEEKASRAGFSLDEIRGGELDLRNISERQVRFVDESMGLISRIVILEDIQRARKT